MAIKKATPAVYHLGIKDESVRTPLPEPLQLPQHLPMFYLQTQRGRELPQLVSGQQMLSTYGSDSFDETEKWYSHQTQGAVITNSNANIMFIKRVVDAAAKKATLRLSLEVGEDVFKPYLRNPDGSVAIDGATGAKKRDEAAEDVTGRICRWIVEEVNDDFGTAPVADGAPFGSAGNASKIYPVMDFEADSVGSWGSNVGVRLWYPHAKTSEAGDLAAMDEHGTNVWRMQVVERPGVNKAPVVVPNQFSSRTTDFSFKRGMLGTANVSYDSQLPVEAFQLKEEGYLPEYGPFGRFHVYNANVDTVQAELDTLEAGVDDMYESAPGRVNIFNAVDADGNDYHSFHMEANGVTLTEGTTVYCQGGDDGEVSESKLDELVKVECDTNWENIDYPLVDHAQYPLSALYDTGFSQETKESMLACMGYRDDISVTVCTQDMAQPENTQAQERAMGNALFTAARMIPESVIYGTPTCRAVIVGQMARLKSSKYGRRLPLVMELIHKRSKFMGAANGIMKAVNAYDISPNNRLDIMVEPSHTWKTDANRDGDWDVGVNWVQYAQMGDIFFPAYQTVYDNDTSVINAEITMLIAVDVKKIQKYLWTEFTGRSDLTEAQYIERLNERFDELVAGRYNGRVRIESDAYITAADAERGYSYTHDAIIYANVMKTVGTFSVITRRNQ